MPIASGEFFPEPHHIIVGGTHSSGKTTMVEGFRDGLQPTGYNRDLPDASTLTEYRYKDREGNVTTVPIVFLPEEATLLSRMSGNDQLFAEQYSPETQLRAEMNGVLRFNDAVLSLDGLARHYGHDKHVIIMDRSPIEGRAYLDLRAPADTRESVTIGDMPFVLYNETDKDLPFDASLGVSSAALEIARSAESVLLTDHTEVPFVDTTNSLRDEAFRNTIATYISALYRSARYDSQRPSSGVFTIHGRPNARVNQLYGAVYNLLKEQDEAKPTR